MNGPQRKPRLKKSGGSRLSVTESQPPSTPETPAVAPVIGAPSLSDLESIYALDREKAASIAPSVPLQTKFQRKRRKPPQEDITETKYNEESEEGQYEDYDMGGDWHYDLRSNLNTFDYHHRKTHAQREEEQFNAWEQVRWKLLHIVAIETEESVPEGSKCGAHSTADATHSCVTCKDVGIPTYLCESCAHAHLSHSGILCHKVSDVCFGREATFNKLKVVDRDGGVLQQSGQKHLACCSNESIGKHQVHLYSSNWNERVMVANCEVHSSAETLAWIGFFPGSPTRPDYAFRFDLMVSALSAKHHIGGSSYHSVFKALLLRQHPNSSSTLYRKLYRPFARALREFENQQLLLRHCRLTKSIVNVFGVGFTECPCIGASDCKAPFRLMYDGLASARKISERKGGGSDSSKSVLEPNSFWPPLVTDVVQEAKTQAGRKGPTVVISDTCDSSFHAEKDTDGDPRCSVNGICAGYCSHQFALFAWGSHLYSPINVLLLTNNSDMVKGEKLQYIDSAIAFLKDSRKHRLLSVFYDIYCRQDVHQESHPTLEHKADLGNLPVLHAFCHGLRCQLLYGTQAGMGSGTFGGETHERGWSTVIKFISPTMYETAGHRKDSLLNMFDAKNQDRLELLLPNILKQLENLLAEISNNIPVELYESVLQSNFEDRRKRILLSKSTNQTSAPSSQDSKNSRHEALLNSAIDIARSIRLRDKLIHRKKGAGGTSIVSSLRRANKADTEKLKVLIGMHNDVLQFEVPDTTELVDANLQQSDSDSGSEGDNFEDTEASLISSEGSGLLTFKDVFSKISVEDARVNASIASWKNVEDLFWIKMDLEAMIGYFMERKQTFWMRTREMCGNAEDMPEWFEPTAFRIMQKGERAEDSMLNEAKEILLKLTSTHETVLKKLDEVEKAWEAGTHVEIFKKLRVAAGWHPTPEQRRLLEEAFKAGVRGSIKTHGSELDNLAIACAQDRRKIYNWFQRETLKSKKAVSATVLTPSNSSSSSSTLTGVATEHTGTKNINASQQSTGENARNNTSLNTPSLPEILPELSMFNQQALRRSFHGKKKLSMDNVLYQLAARAIKKRNPKAFKKNTRENSAHNRALYNQEIAAIRADATRWKEAEQAFEISTKSIEDLVKMPSASINENRALILDVSNRHLRSALNGYEALGLNTTIIQDDFNNIVVNTSGPASRELVRIYNNLPAMDFVTKATQARGIIADRVALGQAVTQGNSKVVPKSLGDKKFWIRQKLKAKINQELQTSFTRLPIKHLRSRRIVLLDLPAGIDSEQFDLPAMSLTVVNQLLSGFERIRVQAYDSDNMSESEEEGNEEDDEEDEVMNWNSGMPSLQDLHKDNGEEQGYCMNPDCEMGDSEIEDRCDGCDGFLHGFCGGAFELGDKSYCPNCKENKRLQ
ncbi:hypothetical protein BDR26DRAFT_922745 [Obelidium mucronatum]|nr:hypothetical protein BDR26DRAFT_922745 [Obelidium mucronatum]